MADIAEAWTEASRSPNCWETDAAPVFILGSDGQAHETRPTTSLAKDLAKSQEPKSSSPSSPSRRRRPEERPLAMTGAAPEAPNRSRVSRVSVADRPLCGFGDASSKSSRRSYGGSSSFEPLTAPANRRSSIASVKDRPDVKRNGRCSYDPIEKLLGMGMDKESARVALCAVGGDVEKAMRLVLEDSKAHVSREACEWEFEGDKGWVPFDVESDRILQNAVDQMKEACELRLNGHRYLIDFNSLTQMNLASQRSRRIRRRSGASSSAAPAAHERGAASAASTASTAAAPSASSASSVSSGVPAAASQSGAPVHERVRAKVPATR